MRLDVLAMPQEKFALDRCVTSRNWRTKQSWRSTAAMLTLCATLLLAACTGGYPRYAMGTASAERLAADEEACKRHANSEMGASDDLINEDGGMASAAAGAIAAMFADGRRATALFKRCMEAKGHAQAKGAPR